MCVCIYKFVCIMLFRKLCYLDVLINFGILLLCYQVLTFFLLLRFFVFCFSFCFVFQILHFLIQFMSFKKNGSLFNFPDFVDIVCILLCQNGGDFLIQANTQKRQKLQEDDSAVFEHVEVGFPLSDLVWLEIWNKWSQSLSVMSNASSFFYFHLFCFFLLFIFWLSVWIKSNAIILLALFLKPGLVKVNSVFYVDCSLQVKNNRIVMLQEN